MDKKTGILVSPENPEELADAVVELLKHPKWAYQMGQAGRKRVEENFTDETYVGNIEMVYNEILKKKARRNFSSL